MMWDNYEISLWTHNDIFVSVLARSGDYYHKEGHTPILKMTTTGEINLNFTIPIVVYDIDSGKLIDNSLWYTESKAGGSLANEKRVKCIFNKGQKDNKGNYTHTIIELVITKMTERRNGLEVYCDVECVGLAFKWLGKTGYQITLDSDTILLDEEKKQKEDPHYVVEPTINYWLDKIFPKDEDGKWATKWGYKIEMRNNPEREPDQVYENNDIISWKETAQGPEPVYSSKPVKKQRFLSVTESNKYNITQDIAELFEVFVRYEFEYEESNPYKIKRGMVVFYNEMPDYSEYAVTFGDNETELSRTADSNDLVTKLFVTDIESDTSDSGLISIANAPSNLTKDNFILNFDYYIQSGQMNSAQINAVYAYERQIRNDNIALETAIAKRNELENAVFDAETQISIIDDKINAAQSNINDCVDKMAALDEKLSNNVLSVNKIACLISNEKDGTKTISFRNAGVIQKTIKILPETVKSIKVITDVYGYATGLQITAPDDVKICYASYDYDLYTYYHTEKDSYEETIEILKSQMALKKAELGKSTDTKKESTLYGRLALAKEDYTKAAEAKEAHTREFENIMGFFLKEGYWTTDNYKAPAEAKTLENCSIFWDDEPLAGEQTSWYSIDGKGGKKYYNYIVADTVITKDLDIENLVILEADITLADVSGPSDLTNVKRYLYNAQYTPQFMKINGDHKFVLLFDKDVSLGASRTLYYSIDNTLTKVPMGEYKSGDIATNQHDLVYRRYAINDENVIASSIQIAANGIELKEYYDYNVCNRKGVKTITFKCNAKVPPNFNKFIVGYKCDRTITQLYYDAQSVSKNSAFPVVSYEVSLAYLQKAKKFNPLNEIYIKENTLAQHFNINDFVNLQLGSIVRINDPQMGFKGVKGIVSELSLDLDRQENTSFVIQNYKTRFEDLFGRIVASSQQMQNNAIAYGRAAEAILPTHQILGSILQNTISNNNLVYNSGRTSGVTFDDYGITVETTFPYTNGITGQLLLRGGAILLSDSLDADGNRLYTTGITPSGINASVITAGRLDTEKINIYSGDQVRFSWTADGLYAYKADVSGATDFDTYIKYNEDGLHFIDNSFEAVSLGWDGLYLGALEGGVEITADEGLSMYNGPKTKEDRTRLLHIGRFNDESNNEVYGFRLFDNNAKETLVTNNTGKLWLKDTLTIGEDSISMVGLTGTKVDVSGEIVANPARIWAGSENPYDAPFIVYANGRIKAYEADIKGAINATEGRFEGDLYALNGYIGGWEINEYNLSSGNIKLSSADNPPDDPRRIIVTNPQIINDDEDNDPDVFYITNSGLLYAQNAKISGIINANGGTIGGWEIGQNTISSGNVTLSSIQVSDEDQDPVRIRINHDNFTVTDSGILNANNANIAGTINAFSGNIGGWEITQQGLSSKNNMVGLYTGEEYQYNGKSIRFWATNEDSEDEEQNTFTVTSDGKMYATGAVIDGTIIARSGYIANIFRIGNEDSGITMSAEIPGQSFISTNHYVSGAFGYGWKLWENGDAEFTNISARGKIQTAVFEYNKISAVGGNLYISPTIYTTEDSEEITSTNHDLYDFPFSFVLTIPYPNLDNYCGRAWSIYDVLKIDGDLVKYQENGDIDELISVTNVDAIICDIYTESNHPSNMIIEENTCKVLISFNPYDVINTINNDSNNKKDYSNYKFMKGTVIVFYGAAAPFIAGKESSSYYYVYKDTDKDYKNDYPWAVSILLNTKNFKDHTSYSWIRGHQVKIQCEFNLCKNGKIGDGGSLEKSAYVTLDGVFFRADDPGINNNEAETCKVIFCFKTPEGFNDTFGIQDLYYEDGSYVIGIKHFVALLSHGMNARQGIYLSACDSGAPFIDIYDDNRDPNEYAKVRLGLLTEITDSDFHGGQLKGYGLYSTNAYLKGQLMLPSAGITNQNDKMYGSDYPGFEDSPVRIWAGTDSIDSIENATFIVTQDGSVYATKGVFKGNIYAKDGVYSGRIEAAGVIINDEDDDTRNTSEMHDHFYVAYPVPSTEKRPYDPRDYIINIDKNGISIWEGALNAYSDFASKVDGHNYCDSIYGYDPDNLARHNPQPYFTLVDDGEVDEKTSAIKVDSRIVANKAHFMSIISNNNNYLTSSIIVDNGIWFANWTQEKLENIEYENFHNIAHDSGITVKNISNNYNNQYLSITSPKFMELNAGNSVLINPSSNDLTAGYEQALVVRGNIKLVNNDSINSIFFGNQEIREAKDTYGNSIGFNFVTK